MERQKKINLIVGTLVVGAIFVLLLDRRGNTSQHDLVGTELIDTEQAAGLTGLEITKGETKLVLVKAKEGWTVADGKTSLPLDGAKLANLIDSLSKTKVQRVVQKELKQPDTFGIDAATQLVLQFEKTSVLFKLGNERSGGGQYLQVDAGKEVFLINEALRVANDLEDWELKVLVSIAPEEVKSIDYNPAKGKGKVTVSREAKDKPLAVVGLKQGEKGRESAIVNLSKALDSFRFDKKVDKSNAMAKSAIDRPVASVIFSLFDGRTYSAKIGRVGKDNDKKYFLTLDGNASKKDIAEDLQSSLSVLNGLSQRFYFEVSSWSAEKLLKDRADLVEKEKKS